MATDDLDAAPGDACVRELEGAWDVVPDVHKARLDAGGRSIFQEMGGGC